MRPYRLFEFSWTNLGVCVFLIIKGVWPNCDLEPQLGQFMKVILSLLLTNMVDVLRMYSTNCLRQVSAPGSRRGAKDRHKGPQGSNTEPQMSRKGTNGEPRGTKREPKATKREPKATKGTPKGTRREPRMEWSQGDHMGPSKLQNWSPKRSRNEKSRR